MAGSSWEDRRWLTSLTMFTTWSGSRSQSTARAFQSFKVMLSVCRRDPIGNDSETTRVASASELPDELSNRRTQTVPHLRVVVDEDDIVTVGCTGDGDILPLRSSRSSGWVQSS